MKTDLVTSIGAALLGSVVAFFICNTLLPEIETTSFKKLQDDSNSSYNLAEPNPEVFNYRALNPTVEVYVGDCTEFDEYGNCITEQDEPIDDETKTPEEPVEEENGEQKNDDTETPTDLEPDQENQNGSTN